ncbi:MAG: ATP-binding protein, partial [Bacteroidota bacterium]
IRAEKEAQYHYLRSIVQHINIGLIAIDEYQEVQLINNAAKRLLGINHLDTLQMLQENFPELVASIEALHSEEKKVLKFQVNEEIAQITLSATSIKLLGKTYKLVSLQDIHTELEEKEMEAWQNLTRVLTHEIINSVTPITSLASTLAQELDEQVDDNGGYEFIESEEIKDAHKAIQVIEKRSAALVDFVTDFRNFTKIPSPKFQLFEVEELFKGIEILMKDDFKKVDIIFHYEVQPAHLQLSADPALIEQILINLITNSMQALHNIAEARIILSAQVDENSKVVMKVSDNGAGISEEARKHIFVPFFTTKRTGSGIGLSLSRQIMRMHGGSITVNSVPKQETTFTLKFA